MFVEQLRRAVEASPRIELAKVASLLWRAYAAGQVSEDQASELSDLIESRRALPAPPKPLQRRLGSRPRSPASMERRRRWAASGALPPTLAARFTLAETAVLAVLAAEVLRHSRCTLTIGHIAALAGVSETTVRNALRAARGLGLLTIEERRGAGGGEGAQVGGGISPGGVGGVGGCGPPRRGPWGEGANWCTPRLHKRRTRIRQRSGPGLRLPKGRRPGGQRIDEIRVRWAWIVRLHI